MKACIVVVALFALMFGARSAPGARAETADGYKPSSAAASYCRRTGGTVEARQAARNTLSPHPLLFDAVAAFCRYTDAAGSHVAVLLDTLVARKPTLAALAYFARSKPRACRGNPATCYCALLGGADDAGSGGWIVPGRPSDVLEVCVFADRSAIDSFGLFYHAGGIVRGRDLARVLRSAARQ